MAEQRTFGNTETPPNTGGTQVREHTHEGGIQDRDRTQDRGPQDRNRPQEGSSQSRERTPEGGSQGRDSGQEAGTHERPRDQEGNPQDRSRTQELTRDAEKTATAYDQQGRAQVAAAEQGLEETIRAKPLQAVCIAAGIGMLLTLLMRQ